MGAFLISEAVVRQEKMQRDSLLLDDIIKYTLLKLVTEKTSKAIEKETAKKDAPEINQKTQNSEQNFVPFVYTKGLNFLQKFMSFGINLEEEVEEYRALGEDLETPHITYYFSEEQFLM